MSDTISREAAIKEMIKDMTEKTKSIERPQWFTADTFAEHLKAIGSAIKADADAIGHFSEGGRYVKIEAEINPGEAVTTVRYIVERHADPRTRAANHLPESEEDE